MFFRRCSKRLLLVALALSLLITCCMSGSIQAAKPRYVLGFSQVVMNNPYYLALYQGAVDTAERLNVELIWLNADNIVARQIADIEDLVTKKVDGLLINPVTPTAPRICSKQSPGSQDSYSYCRSRAFKGAYFIRWY